MVITIDGPAGSGKSTAARRLAGRLGMAFLDTGATYRAVTLRFLEQGVDSADARALAMCADQADIRLHVTDGQLRVELDGRDVTRQIRTRRVTENAHHVADVPEVREVLVRLQRRIGRDLGSFVAEGRDQGSVVFPEADVKFFLIAKPEVRAQRRVADLAAVGEAVDAGEVLDSILRRDRRDAGRAVAPLIKPEGAVVIDTSDMTIDQTIEAMLEAVGQWR